MVAMSLRRNGPGAFDDGSRANSPTAPGPPKIGAIRRRSPRCSLWVLVRAKRSYAFCFSKLLAMSGLPPRLDSTRTPEFQARGLHVDSGFVGVTGVWHTVCFRARSLRVLKFSVARSFSKSLTCVCE